MSGFLKLFCQNKIIYCLSNIWYVFYGGIHRKTNCFQVQHAPAAMDATFTSTLYSNSLPSTPSNTVISKFWEETNAGTLFAHLSSSSTAHNVRLSIDNPMDDDGATSFHHDSHRLVDLATLWHEISQTVATFNNLFKTIAPSPMQHVSPWPTTMTMTSVSTNDNNVLCHNGHQQQTSNDNDNPSKCSS